jgi:multiple sugar transport system ATP-binding protein
MDEPLSNLDAKLRVQMRAELQKIHKTLKATIVYVTHDQIEAMTLGQRIAVILNGELQQADHPLDVYGKPANRFVAGFVGSPPMNFINGTIEKKGDKYAFVSEYIKFDVPDALSCLGLLEPYIGREVVFGLRPEDIWDTNSSDWIKEKAAFESVVDYREIIGSETYMYVNVGKTQLITRVGGLCDAVAGSVFKIVFRLENLHFFDPINQRTII